jgi:hypothetical protein
VTFEAGCPCWNGCAAGWIRAGIRQADLNHLKPPDCLWFQDAAAPDRQRRMHVT